MSTTPRTGAKSSFIWNFYDVDSFEKARCLICQRIYSRKGCCTSGLITHLKKKHTDTFLLYLNKGVVRLEDVEDSANVIKHEPEENSQDKKVLRPKRKRSNPVKDQEDENSTDFTSFVDTALTSDDLADDDYRPDDEEPTAPTAKPIEQMCLDEDEYPVINIPSQRRKSDNQAQMSPFASKSTTEIESVLKKQLAIQAKLYKELKEKMDEISTHLKESERISRKRYRLKAEKLRILKEDLQKKELHRKEMHRLRLLELDILNKKNIQEQLHYNQI